MDDSFEIAWNFKESLKQNQIEIDISWDYLFKKIFQAYSLDPGTQYMIYNISNIRSLTAIKLTISVRYEIFSRPFCKQPPSSVIYSGNLTSFCS